MVCSLYFVTTRNCNYQCGHCAVEAGPGKVGTTISQANFERVILHLPQHDILLELSGGEVFTVKDRFYGFLDYLRYANKKRQESGEGKIDIWVQTNGFWALDANHTAKILSELKFFHVDELDIASYDKFHQQEGAEFKRLEMLRDMARDSNIFNRVSLRGCQRPGYVNAEILPVGRAKHLELIPQELFVSFTTACYGSLDHQMLSLSEDGSVYNCSFLQMPLPGNLIEEPLEEIIRKAKQDPRLCLANEEEGITALAKLEKWKIEKLLRKHCDPITECLLCAGRDEQGYNCIKQALERD